MLGSSLSRRPPLRERPLTLPSSLVEAPRFLSQSDPRWRVIAGFQPAPHFTVDACRDEHLSRGGVQQKMVNPYPGITGVRIAKVVPESVDRLVRMEFPDGI